MEFSLFFKICLCHGIRNSMTWHWNKWSQLQKPLFLLKNHSFYFTITFSNFKPLFLPMPNFTFSLPHHAFLFYVPNLSFIFFLLFLFYVFTEPLSLPPFFSLPFSLLLSPCIEDNDQFKFGGANTLSYIEFDLNLGEKKRTSSWKWTRNENF